ncbi:MAG TPA: ATP-binding protein [Streptosporangiaceae bacterium]|nr:ATP-binding protein [Streptosporangiaceae bacterium]
MTAGNKPATRATYQDFPVIRAWSDTFPATPEQVRHARRGLTSFLDGSPITADAVTCLSELVTNSIEHSESRAPGGQVTVRATLAAGRLRVEVEDQGGPWCPVTTNAGGLGGRGLRIVAALSRDWGKTAQKARSRTVWFEMGSGSIEDGGTVPASGWTADPPC